MAAVNEKIKRNGGLRKEEGRKPRRGMRRFKRRRGFDKTWSRRQGGLSNQLRGGSRVRQDKDMGGNGDLAGRLAAGQRTGTHCAHAMTAIHGHVTRRRGAGRSMMMRGNGAHARGAAGSFAQPKGSGVRGVEKRQRQQAEERRRARYIPGLGPHSH